MRQRVVIFSAFLTPFRSGAEACAEEVALRLRDACEITIITARLRRDLPKRDSLRGNVPVIRIGIGHSIDKWLYPFVAPFAVRSLKPDVIHAVLETFAGAALIPCRWIVPGAKRLLTLQTTNRSLLKSAIIRSADKVTAISSTLVAIAKEAGKDAVLIPNGIDLHVLEEARNAHQKAEGSILFVGRLEPMKGVDVLLKAIAMLITDADRHSKIDARRLHAPHLRIVGDGSQRGSLEKLARELGIADRVTFAGRIDPGRIAMAFAQAEIFCGLSRSEALGNVFLEAQAAGCAVIGTNVGGIPDIVKHERTGMLVPPNDPEAAAGMIARLMHDPPLRSALSAAAIEHAKRFDWSAIARAYAGVWDGEA